MLNCNQELPSATAMRINVPSVIKVHNIQDVHIYRRKVESSKNIFDRAPLSHLSFAKIMCVVRRSHACFPNFCSSLLSNVK